MPTGSNRLVLPGDNTPDGNKYSVDLSEADPIKIMLAVHKRIVDLERRFNDSVVVINELKNEVEMLNNQVKVLEEKSKSGE